MFSTFLSTYSFTNRGNWRTEHRGIAVQAAMPGSVTLAERCAR